MTIQQQAAEARGMAALAKVRDAIISGDDFEPFLLEFDASMMLADDETQDLLMEARDALIDGTADEAFAAYAEVTARARSLSDGFRMAEQVAEDAEGGLFFPAAAAHMAKVAALVDQINKAAISIQGNVDDISEAFRERDVKDLIKEGQAIMETVENMVGTLTDLSDEFVR